MKYQLYKFYKSYFGYISKVNAKQSFYFAHAVNDTRYVLQEISKEQSYNPLIQYRKSKYCLDLALNFLGNIESIAKKYYDNPIKNYNYIDAKIIINKNLLINRRKDVYILCPFIIDKNNKDIIFISFGLKEKFLNENQVLKGLLHYFSISSNLLCEDNSINYWDIKNNVEKNIQLSKIEYASKGKLIACLNSLK